MLIAIAVSHGSRTCKESKMKLTPLTLALIPALLAGQTQAAPT